MTDAEELELLELENKNALAKRARAAQAQKPPPEKSLAEMALDALRSGEVRALGRGALQGATLNFGDEIQGGIGQLMQRGVNTIPDFVLDAMRRRGIDLNKAPENDAYTYVRDADRASNKAAEAAHGGYYLGGNLAGGLVTAPLMPGAGAGASFLRTLGTSAAVGGLQGLGASDSNTLAGNLGNTALGGLLGAGAGTLGYGLGKAATGVSEWAGGKAAAIRDAVEAAGKDVAGSETATFRSAAGNSAVAAYKNATNIEEALKAGALTVEELTPEQAGLYRALLRERAQKAAEALPGDAGRKTAKAAEYVNAMATEDDRAAKYAADKLSAGEFKRQVGARALRYGLPALGGMGYQALTGDHSPSGLLKGAGLGGLAGAGMRPMMHSLLRLGRQPVVQNQLWGLLSGAGRLGQAVTPGAESLLVNEASGSVGGSLSELFRRAVAERQGGSDDAAYSSLP